MNAKNSKKKIRLVLVGGGHANTQVLKRLQGKIAHNVTPILLSDYKVALYSGMCPGGVAQQYTEREFSIDLVQCAKAWGWQFICKKIVEIKAHDNLLIASDGSHIPYDVMVLNIGSTNVGYHTYPGVRQYAISTRPLKRLMQSVDQAEDRLLKKIAAQARTHRGRKPLTFRFITVGSGCAGCELIMGLSHRLKRSIQQYMDTHNLTVPWLLKPTLITNSSSILAKEPDALRNKVIQKLHEQKIEILTHHKVFKVNANVVHTLHKEKEKSVAYDILLWATGAAAHPIKSDDIAKDDHGWFEVNSYLQSVSHPNIFGAGDCVNLPNDRPEPFPPKAGVYAVRQGPILAHNVQHYLHCLAQGKGSPEKGFQPYQPQSDFLRLINTGDGKGIGCKYGIALQGQWVWKMKDWIDRRWVNKFYTPPSSDK